jgi:heme oxygenase
LASLAASEPLLLLAHAQTMYVALLAGGTVLARMLRAARALPPGEGTAIFDFEAVLPAAEQRRFRDALRAAVDAVGVKLSGAPLLRAGG